MGRIYYEELKTLARTIREKHNVVTSDLGLRKLKSVCAAEGITKVDLWKPRFKKVRAAYIAVGDESFILLNANIKPVEPRLFSLAHELKHHLRDRDQARDIPLGCGKTFDPASATEIEIGAEIFAAEFIFPELECREWIETTIGYGTCTAADVVRLKRSCPAKVSYTFIVKRLERFGRVPNGAFENVKFQNLEDNLYGVPYYRRRTISLRNARIDREIR